jgi:hypothetical protein
MERKFFIKNYKVQLSTNPLLKDEIEKNIFLREKT